MRAQLQEVAEKNDWKSGEKRLERKPLLLGRERAVNRVKIDIF